MVLIGTAALIAAGCIALALLTGTEPATADQNPSHTLCKGHIQKGAPDPSDPTATQVEYVFACSGKLTGYQIQTDHAVQSMETEIFATDRLSKQVVPTDSFGCNGDIPGFGVNCTGVYGGDWRVVRGTFSIDEKLCDEPRVDPLLSITYATADAKGVVTQYIAGPFDLGRPHGCPKSARGGKTRIPAALQ
jgi:hypothetical protein